MTLTFKFLQNEVKRWESTTYAPGPCTSSISQHHFNHHCRHPHRSAHHIQITIKTCQNTHRHRHRRHNQSQGCTDFSVKLETASCQLCLGAYQNGASEWELYEQCIQVFRQSEHACSRGSKQIVWLCLGIPKTRLKVATLQLRISEMKSSNICLSKGPQNSLTFTFTRFISVAVILGGFPKPEPRSLRSLCFGGSHYLSRCRGCQSAALHGCPTSAIVCTRADGWMNIAACWKGWKCSTFEYLACTIFTILEIANDAENSKLLW